MNVGQLKSLIKNIPDDYIIQVNVAVHPDDTDDSDVDHLAVKKKVEVNEANKSLFLSVGLRTLMSK
jgi:hypothetical protein